MSKAWHLPLLSLARPRHLLRAWRHIGILGVARARLGDDLIRDAKGFHSEGAWRGGKGVRTVCSWNLKTGRELIKSIDERMVEDY
ncbi:hypothetical protein BDZ45DRAFT_672250 [Acephala macrosclerotiorum]|nr:hypothetical protein BDZ45DRAFT_672250 [Acephala macrosclerotiorum]